MARYRNDWMPEDERRDASMRFDRALALELVEVDPEGTKREAEVLMADGSVKETCHAVPIYRKLKKGEKRQPGERPINEFRTDRKTGELVPGITCPEGGYIAGGSAHAGSGFNFVPVMDQGGNIVSWSLTALNVPENVALYDQRAALNEYLRHVGVELSILTTDTAFHSTPEQGMPRGAWHDIRVIENIGLSSHSDSDVSVAKAIKRRKQRINLAWNDKFWLDGHRQGHCKHGKAKVVRRVDERAHHPGVTVRTEYVCTSKDKADFCGSVTLTAGGYRPADNGKTLVKTKKEDQHLADWNAGNFMTFDDAEYTKKFGFLRNSMQEGFFGAQLTNRLATLEKRWIRRMAQAEIDIAMSLSILCAAKIARRREQLNKPRLQPVVSAPALALAA
jgi:hypothetical protein